MRPIGAGARLSSAAARWKAERTRKILRLDPRRFGGERRWGKRRTEFRTPKALNQLQIAECAQSAPARGCPQPQRVGMQMVQICRKDVRSMFLWPLQLRTAARRALPLHRANRWAAALAQRCQQPGGACGHKVQVGAGHHELKALFVIALDFFYRSRRSPQELSMALGCGCDSGHGLVQLGMTLAPAKAKRKG